MFGKLPPVPPLSEHEESAEDIYQQATCAHLSVLTDGRMVKVNQTFLNWFGYSESEVLGKLRFQDLLTSAGRIFMQTHLGPMLHARGYFNEVALDLLDHEGKRRPFLVNGVQRVDAQGRAVVNRITLFSAADRSRYEEELMAARRKAEEATARMAELNVKLICANADLHRESERLRVTLNAIGEGVFATDTEGRISFINPAGMMMLGQDVDALGRPWLEIFPLAADPERPLLADPVRFVLDSSQTALTEQRSLLRPDGQLVPIRYTAAPIRNEQGTVIGAIVVMRDISEMVEMSERLQQMATHDSLTGLINRAEFEQRLEAVLREGPDDLSEHTLLYIDLDQFKVVNDTCGHLAGDNLLRQLSALMRAQLRSTDTLGRLGGDEFGVLLRGCSRADGEWIAHQLRKVARDFQFVWEDKVFPAGASIGLASFRTGSGLTVQDLFRMADEACYLAKDMGRDRVQVYAPDDQELKRRNVEMNWVARIRKALDHEQLVLYAQEIVPCAGRAHGERRMEVLVRMLDEQGKVTLPMAFIPAAERYGLMHLVDRWVISRTLQYLSQHPVAEGETRCCAINLSAHTVCDLTFLDFIREQFRATGVAPQTICFEITETAAIANLAQATDLMRALKALGCRFSLDDFGSGMSSFSYLKNLPVDYLKIDGSFVKDMLEDRVSRVMVSCINQIGHEMGIRTVAEFVESPQLMQQLHQIGVDYAQGYAIGRPMPLEQLMPAAPALSIH